MGLLVFAWADMVWGLPAYVLYSRDDVQLEPVDLLIDITFLRVLLHDLRAGIQIEIGSGAEPGLIHSLPSVRGGKT